MKSASPPFSAPVATYRLQFHKDFTFQDGTAIVPYLKALNVSHLYASPVLESAAGSTHGYDVQDFAKVSAERGGEAALLALDAALRAQALDMMLDIVPNHMAAAPENPYWRDVLANGRQSQYWSLFDMRVPEGDKIHLAVLADDVRKLFDDGKLKVDFANHRLEYFDTHYPLSPLTGTYEGDLTFEQFSEVLAAQNYQLVPWTEVMEKVSYRRFFDVSTLIGVRIEDRENFDLAHAKLFEMLQALKSITALRTDHIDGLADPKTYLDRLSTYGLPVWCEKILGRDETLVGDWPIAGTTGYEFIDQLNQLFVDSDGFKTIEDFWRQNVESQWPDFAACVADGKKMALETLFPSEAKRLGVLSADDPAAQKRAQDFWSALSIALPVYRVYAGQSAISEADRDEIRLAAGKARARDPGFASLEKEFMPALLDPQTDRQLQAIIEWQQLSGPVMAKGQEDCAHYRYTPLAALNEVGCPAVLNDSDPARFFTWLAQVEKNCPNTLKATSTHDTKRSEDTRHRLYALADRPQDWLDFYRAMSAMNARHKNPKTAPSVAAEYMLYQAIVGTWPLNDVIDNEYVGRIAGYMKKALAEARQETSWTKPDAAYEAGVKRFVETILKDDAFISKVQAFCRRLAPIGAINSLAVQTVKILTPGVPDIYQGTECWDFSLVDPDNRRPVDFTAHQVLQKNLTALEAQGGRAALLRRLIGEWQDGGIKQWLTCFLLDIRSKFLAGSITTTQLKVSGASAENIVAYTIEGDAADGLVVVVPRFPGQITNVQIAHAALQLDENALRDVIIDDLPRVETFRNLILDTEIDRKSASRPAKLFAEFPVAVLHYKSQV